MEPKNKSTTARADSNVDRTDSRKRQSAGATNDTWSAEVHRKAYAEAVRGAKGNEDDACEAILRMVNDGAAPEHAFGFGRNLRRERLTEAKRRNALAPMIGYDPGEHDHEEPQPDEPEDIETSLGQEFPADRAAALVAVALQPAGYAVQSINLAEANRPPDYAAMFARAAQGATYMAGVLSTTAVMFDGIARGLTEHLDAPPSADMLEALANFARLQRAFSSAADVSPTPPQVALSIQTALRIARPPDADLADWLLGCIAVDFYEAPLRADPATRALLAMITRESTDKQLARAAGALLREQTSDAAVRQVRKRRT